ncbi:MAG: universal stress protein [Pirellulales bacterium]
MGWTAKHCIVVPFDFSDHSHKAIDLALEMVDAPEHVHVIHVLPFIVPSEPGVVWGMVDDSVRLKHALDALEDELKDGKYAKIAREVLIGDPGGVITDRSKELHADLIILPSHGRTGLTRILLGSVAERVVRLAECPVLVFKLKEGE